MGRDATPSTSGTFLAPGEVKSYWLVYDIPSNVTRLPRNAMGIGVVGLNDKGRTDYDPMCSRGPGPKTYHITVYALSAELGPSRPRLNRAAFLEAIKGKQLARGTLTFTYTAGDEDDGRA